MNLYSVWPYWALVVVILLLIRADPLFKVIDGATPEAGSRLGNIDGLRGFLALGVFGHHAVITHEYVRTGYLAGPASSFYMLLGQSGVGVVFPVSGFLFLGKLLHGH